MPNGKAAANVGERIATVEEHCKNMDSTLTDIKGQVFIGLPAEMKAARELTAAAIVALTTAVNGRVRRLELAVMLAIGIAIGSGILGAVDVLKIAFGG